ncbi:MAG TPA: NAD-binding protein [Anaerolineaceae bacterium]|nr:NAD-binding protein [Anaerolineaceae bacterium]HPN50621.1 NAD-binding protein [Anaerolineaceae bacterium]
MRVLIIGAGRTGSQLANLLVNQDHEVRLIEDRRQVLSRLHKELPTEVIIEGNPMDPNVLEQAGIKDAEIVAAVTTSDEQNLALCYFARTKYHVARTIARVNDPRHSWVFNETFAVDVPVNQAEIMSRLIEEEMAMGDMMTLLKLRRGNYSLVEDKAFAGARAIGVPIKDLGLPETCVIAAIIRKGQVVAPRGMTAFEIDDEVLAVTDPDGAKKLKEMLEPAETEENAPEKA